MKSKFSFDKLDGITKGIIFIFDVLFKYILGFLSRTLFHSIYFIDGKVLLKRFWCSNLFYLSCLITVSFPLFFLMLSGELLVFLIPITIFCFFFFNFFLSNYSVDYLEEIELIEFLVQLIEIFLWNSFKFLYFLLYVIYIYRFLVDFFSFYFNKLFSCMFADSNYNLSQICKVFLMHYIGLRNDDTSK